MLPVQQGHTTMNFFSASKPVTNSIEITIMLATTFVLLHAYNMLN